MAQIHSRSTVFENPVERDLDLSPLSKCEDCEERLSTTNSGTQASGNETIEFATGKEDPNSDTKDKEVANCDPMPGVIYAGPGEDKMFVNFDVKAFFEDSPDIKNIGKDNNLSFRISGDAQIMKDILKAHGFTELPYKSRYGNFSWIGNSVSELFIDQLLEFQSVNHFVGSTHLTRKDQLYKNLSKIKKKKGAVNFDFIPTSFVLPKHKKKFKAYFKKSPGPFIVKPVGLSRGRGVYLIGKPKDIFTYDEDQIVSKYICNPLLIDGYKIDLRIYVLVTSFNPLVIYIYQEGLTRFATVKYKNCRGNLSALRMHLTNYSINITSGNYIRNEDSSIEDFGSKWTLSALLRYFQAKGIDTIALMSGIEDLIIKTILSVEKPIAAGCRAYQHKPSNCFELFGFDIMVDQNYKAWLLEVNLSPSLVCTTPLDIKVKSNMLCDLLNLVGVECYQKEKPNESGSCGAKFDHYIHRTVGYFCICVIRDEIRQLIHRRKKRKRCRDILGTYKNTGSSGKEQQQQQEEKRARLLENLTPREHAMIARVRNEQRRCGGWVKIFPTVDSWGKYGDMMQYKTTLNAVLHQNLYPHEHTECKLPEDKTDGPALSESDENLLKNTEWDYKTELTEARQEMLQRVKRYQTSLEVGPPPLFTVRPCIRDCYKVDDEIILDEGLKKRLLSQIIKGYVFTEVQARTAFLRYLTTIKQIVRECKSKLDIITCPPVSFVEDLLFQFLGHSSDLVLDPTNPSTKYTLDSCLTNFIYHYHKETRQMMRRGESLRWATGDRSDHAKAGRKFVGTELFEEFIHSADPWEMEELLMNYMRVHGDATIFMRTRIQNGTPGKCNLQAMPRVRMQIPLYPEPGEVWTTV